MTTAAHAPARTAEPAAASSQGPPLRLQRQCGCGAGTSGLSQDCGSCQKKKLTGGQPRLAIGASGDRFEREADAVAERVLSGRPAAPGTAAPMQMQRVDTGSGGLGEAPAEVHQVVDGPARGLDGATRGFFEARFGHDFSRVRVHDDADADRSARAVGAHAYTVGRDLVFARGQYQPQSAAGRRLLAHELTHVVQQQASRGTLQRDDDKDKKPAAPKPTGKTDVAIVLTGDDQDMIEGQTYAKTALRVTSAADAAAQLKALGVPIGRLIVVSHSNAAGNIEVVSSIGTISWVPAGEFGKALKGSATIDDIDFRGCMVGKAPAALDAARQNSGAKSARAANCWTITQHASPISVDGVDITSDTQIPKGKGSVFDAALLRQIEGMQSDNRKHVGRCLVGLTGGELPSRQIISKLRSIYFAHGGNLFATWASPQLNNDWQPGSICSRDMTETTKPCAIVVSTTPAPTTTPPAGGKTGMLEGDSHSDSDKLASATETANDREPGDAA